MRRSLISLFVAVSVMVSAGVGSVHGDELEQGLDLKFRQGRVLLVKACAKLRKSGSAAAEIEQVRKLSEEVQADSMLLMERYRLRQEKATDMGGTVVARQSSVTAGFAKALEEYLALIAAIPPDGSVTPAALESLDKILDQLISKKKLPLLGNLPYRHTSFPTKEPDQSTSVIPAYQGGESPVTSRDTESSAEAEITPAIGELAKSLSFNPVLIYEWVKNNVDTEWYWGCMKGAEETLRQKSGNDCDQAALLTALLRASGFPTRYVHGVMEFFPDLEMAKNLTGVEDPMKLALFLQRAGIPSKPVIAGGKIANIRMEHVWVETLVPYSNYRGAVIDNTGKIWVALDTHIKASGYRWNSPVALPPGLSLDGLRDGYLSESRPETPLEYVRAGIGTHLSNTSPGTAYQQLLKTRTLNPEVLNILPASLQFRPVGVSAEYTEIPVPLRHAVRFTATAGTRELFSVSLDAFRLAGKKTVLAYEPESVEDQMTIDSFGGLDNTPAYLVRLRPVLKVNDERVVVGQDGLPAGSEYTLAIEAVSPNGAVRASSTPITGNLSVLVVAAQRGAPDAGPAETDNAETLLFKEANSYVNRWSRSEDELASLLGVALSRPVPIVATVGNLVDVTRLGDTPQEMKWKGVFLDANLRAVEVVGPNGSSQEKTFMHLSGLEGSILENRVFEDDFQVESTSTAKLFQAANAQGVPFVTIDRANLDSALADLSVTEAIKADIRNGVQQGLTVRIPQVELTMRNWSGTGYIKENSETGEAGWMLSGMVAGGMSVVGYGSWREDLLSALRNQYVDSPNRDPGSAVNIEKIPATDFQVGAVGESLSTPVQVMVKDDSGRPVPNVPVTFKVLAGGGTFSDYSTSFSVKTNGSGIASAHFILGQQTGSNPVYFKEEGDTFPRQYGANIVDASLASGTPITSPFTLFGKPGKVSRIRKLHEVGEKREILSFAGFVSLAVEDRYGNPVSNQKVTFVSEAPVDTMGCPNPNQDARPAKLIKTGDPCLDGVITYKDLNSCSTQDYVISDISSVYGSSVHLVLGAVPGARYPVKATVKGDVTLSETFSVFSEPFGNCSGESEPAGTLITTYIYPADAQGHNIKAANIGRELRIEAKIFYLKEGEKEVQRTLSCDSKPPLTCPALIGTRKYTDTTDFVSSSVTIDGVSGKRLGNGEFETYYRLKPGRNGILIVGRAGINCKEATRTCTECGGVKQIVGNAESLTYMELYGVDIKTSISDAVQLGNDGYSRNDVKINYEISPSDYQASSATVFIYKGEEIVAAIPSGTKGAGSAVLSHGFKFEPGATYSAQVILNYGSEVEIQGDRTSIDFFGAPFSLQRVHLESKFGPPLTDLAGSYIDGYKVFYFKLDEPNTVSVSLLGADRSERGTIISETPLPAGEHRFVVNYGQLANLGINTAIESGFHLRLNFAETFKNPARSTVYRGRLSARPEGKMLGQPVVHDVLIPDGSLNLTREDFAFKGRGPQLAFSRNYTNQATPDDRQYLGEGWSHTLDYQLRPLSRQDSGNFSIPDWVRNMEGKFFSPGEVNEGNIQWTSVSVNGGLFRKHNGVWYADRGRHGRLAETAEGLVFTAKDGTRYVYDYPVTQDPVPVRYIEDRNGNRMNFAYNGFKQLERVTDAVGRSCEFGYINFFASATGGGARLASVSCSDGIELALGYNQDGYLQEVKRGNRTEKYEYAHEPGIVGPEFNLVKVTDSNGHSFKYEYYQAGELQPGLGDFVKALRFQDVVKRVEYPDARNALFFYDVSNGNKRTVRDLRGKDTVYTLNFYGNPLKIEEPLGKTTLMTWSIDEGKNDNVTTSRTDAKGYLTTYEYDPQGNVVKETDPYGKSIISSWNQAFSLIESRTDRNNVNQTWQYDARGNLLTHKDGDGKQHSFTWYPTGEMESSADPRLFKTTHTWDRYGNPDSDTAPEGSVTRYTHDIRGRRTSVTDPNGRKTEYTWDALDHPATVASHPFSSYALAGGSGNIKTTVYDAEGNLVSETDRVGLTTTYTYTPRDQVKTITRNAGGSKTFDYDGNGNIVSETDWKGVATTHTYDDLNRRDSTTDRAGHTSLMGYDLNGNLTSETDAEGRVTNHEYDKLNRLVDTWQPALAGQERGNLHYTYYDEGDPKTNLKSETDQESHTTGYEYNGRYLRTKRTDARLGIHLWQFDDSGNLAQETDEEGRVTGNDYDNRDRLVAVHRKLEGEEIVTRYQYDRAGNRTHVTDALGHVTETVYDEWNRPWKTVDPEGRVSVTELDGEGRDVRTVDANLTLRTKARDQRGLVTGAVDGEGNETRYSYDLNGNTTTIIDARGAITGTTYDAEDRKLLTTEAQGLPEERTSGVVLYDKVGNPLESRDGNNNIHKTYYNVLNLPERACDPAPFATNCVETTYYKTGKVKTVKDRRGFVTVSEYDELNRPVKVTDPLNQTVETAYDKVGNVKTAKDKRNIVSETDYNELNLVKEKRRAGVRLVSNQYDGAGNLRFVTDANNHKTEYIYNRRNLLDTTVFPDATTEKKTYDGVGNLLTVTDEEGKTTSHTYDRENRRTSTELAGERTVNRYDQVGNLKEIVKPEGNSRSMEHDGLKRLVAVTEGGLVTRYRYDANGNVTHQFDARGNDVEFTWDELNRKKEHIRHKGDGNLVSTYAEYDPDGNLKKEIDPKGQEFAYDYDQLNRRTDEHYPTAATPYLTTTRVHYEHDGNNNETSVTETKTDIGGAMVTDTTANTYDDFDRLKTSATRGVTVSYDYDANGNRTGVSTASGATAYTFDARNRVKTAIAGATTTFDYYPDGKQKTVSYPNGAAVSYSYYPTERVKDVTNTAGAATISRFDYDYDHNGNRTRQVETRPAGSETTTYRYDSQDRMESFTVVKGSTSVTTNYTFDGYNRSGETVWENGTQILSKSYSYDETDWLNNVQITDHGITKTINYTYDKNGNTVRKQDTAEADPFLYDYDSDNRLVRAMKGTTLLGLYDYNSDGLRIRHRNSERGDVDYFYDGKAVIEERQAGGGLLAHYRYAGKPLSLLAGGALQFYHFDALGSTVNLTNASGGQQAGYFLDPWGHVKEKEGDSVNRQIFTGQEHDEKTGLIYFGARYYDPDTARFMTEDSFLGEVGTPPSLNRYLYAYSNPTVYIDLEGYENQEANSSEHTSGGEEKSWVDRQIERYSKWFASETRKKHETFNKEYLSDYETRAARAAGESEEEINSIREHNREVHRGYEEATEKSVRESTEKDLKTGKDLVVDYATGKSAAVIGGAIKYRKGLKRGLTAEKAMGGEAVKDIEKNPGIGKKIRKFFEDIGLVKKSDSASELQSRTRTGAQGELKSTFTKIEPQHLDSGTPTTDASRAYVRKLGRATDDAGHAVGRKLGGKGGATSGNIFPQTPSVNRGKFARFEKTIAEEVRAGKEVYVRVVPKYKPSETRPYEIVYQVRINGKTTIKRFPNP